MSPDPECIIRQLIEEEPIVAADPDAHVIAVALTFDLRHRLERAGFHLCSEGEAVIGGQKVRLEHPVVGRLLNEGKPIFSDDEPQGPRCIVVYDGYRGGGQPLYRAVPISENQ